MKLLRFLTLLVAALFLAGCLLPPVDLGLSLSTRTTARMTLEEQIGPLELYIGIIATSDFFFVPSASKGFDHGFLVSRGDAGATVFYIGVDAGGSFRASDTVVYAFDSSTEGSFSFTVFPLKNTLDSLDHVFVSARSAASEYSDYSWDSSDSSVGAQPGGGDTSVTDHVGGYSAAVNSSTVTSLIRLELTGTGQYKESLTEYTDAAQTGFLTRTLVTIPDSPTEGFFMRDSADTTGTAFMSTPADNGQFYLYRWSDASLVANPEAELIATLDYPVQHVLSNGNLYSTGDGQDRVLDSDGNELWSFPTGALHFAGERYVNGEARMIYTMAFWSKPEGDDSFYIRVYSHPTDSLSALAD